MHVFVVDCSNRMEIYNSVDQVRTRVSAEKWMYQLTVIWEGERFSGAAQIPAVQ